MITLGNRTLCSSCFAPIKAVPCKQCGFYDMHYRPDLDALQIGSILMGQFLIGKVLSKGSTCITYMAYDVKFGTVIAIKEYYPKEIVMRKPGDLGGVLIKDSQSAEEFYDGVESFYRRSSLLSKFAGNSGIVKVYQFFYENDTVYCTMEYLDGMTLRDYVEKVGTLTAGQAVYVADMVVYALHALHYESLLHGGLSPDSIMLCTDGQVKLLNLDHAMKFGEDSDIDPEEKLSGFAPIEQYQVGGKQGEWTDMYYLAASLCYALTKRVPDVPQKRMKNDEDIINNAYDIQPNLWNVIRKAMQVKYIDRYPGMAEFNKALTEIPIKRQGIKVPH